MQSALIDLVNWLGESALLMMTVFLRIGAAMALMPGFGERTISIRVRLVLALAFSAVVWPMVQADLNGGSIELRPIAFLAETVNGLAIGFFFRLFVVVLQVAGMMAAQATSLSQIFGPAATPDPLPAIGNLLVIGGFALAMTSGLHAKLAIALAETYSILPVGQMPYAADLTVWGISGISHAFASAFVLAAPFIILSVIYNLALALINRAMPQLMVAFIGAPAITLGGLVMLLVSLPTILVLWLRSFDEGLANPFEILF